MQLRNTGCPSVRVDSCGAHRYSGDEAEPLKMCFAVSMINWLYALYADFCSKSFDALVPHWQKCLKTGIGYVEK